MQNCCEKCFKDIYIRRFICSKGTLGECSYCESKQVYISDIEIVGDFIKAGLLKKYQPVEYDADYSSLIRDGLMYTDSLTETAKCRLYEEDIFAKSNYELLLDDLFEYGDPDYRDISKGAEDLWENGSVELISNDVLLDGPPVNYLIWNKFKDNIKHYNRFFDLGAMSREELLSSLSNTIESITITLPCESLIYRARLKPKYLIPNDVKSLLQECGPPPVELSKSLRMNPVGISYFYGSNDIKTSLVEIRAGFNDSYILGNFKTRIDLKLIDLTLELNREIESIFSDDYDQYFWENKSFLEAFAEEISKPVSDIEAPIEYLPTQLLSEYLRKEGFNGICYKSSLTGEKNYTLFCGPEAESYPYPNIGSEDIPTEFTEWLYLAEYNEGVINDIGYKSLINPKKIDFNENPIPFSEREDGDKELLF